MSVLNKEKTAVRDSYASNVEQFLNRIMVLHVEKQNPIFDLFYERYLKAVEAAKQQGAFDQQAGFAGSAWRRFAPATCEESPKRKRCSCTRHPAPERCCTNWRAKSWQSQLAGCR